MKREETKTHSFSAGKRLKLRERESEGIKTKILLNVEAVDKVNAIACLRFDVITLKRNE